MEPLPPIIAATAGNRLGQAEPDLESPTGALPTSATGGHGNDAQKQRLELVPTDFREEDWDRVIDAAGQVMRQVEDISFHRIGDYWTPWATPGDVIALIAEVRGILAQLDAPIREAHRALARIEGTARLRARRRSTSGQDES
ncbi:hypothetical protein [Streptomyces albidoflavus]|uniref:hypothetical protein n=1 Tax=Streptomyces albidoflavus TaxID=1886 RepID=UPI003327EA4B